MQNMYDALRQDHHLKHFGRLQLRNFLKVSSTADAVACLLSGQQCPVKTTYHSHHLS